ncbi:MAG: hypothetical protein K6G90_01460 [Clostridia bacterium]|nr:hypothetical protein [Clostridia bacterium]
MKIRKLISVLLAVFLFAQLCLPAVSAGGEEIRQTPIITVPGTSNCHIVNGNGDVIIPNSSNDFGELIKDREFMEPLLKQFAKSVATNCWDKYCDMLVGALTPIWEDQLFDGNGEPTHGDAPQNVDWSAVQHKTSGFTVNDFVFKYDWRLDPFAAAAQLDGYIDNVLAATGAEKVALVGRCYGANVLSAYLAEYGTEKVSDSIYYCSLAKGNEQVDALYTGSIALDADILDMYANYFLKVQKPVEDDDLTLFLASLVTLMNYTCSLDLTAAALEKLIGKFKDNILPRILRAGYGTYPGYWSMVSSEAYESAKEYVFADNAGDYAGLIEKTDRYHYEVQEKLDDILDGCIADGMRIMVICKYNEPAYPFFEGCDYQSDNSCSLGKQSFGATASKINKFLGDDYIAGRTAQGFGDYISPDRKIDASTAKFADCTWFFKNVDHLDHDGFLMRLIELGTQSQVQFTVRDTGTYPQFIKKLPDGSFGAVTADDEEDAIWAKTPFFTALKNLFSSLFALLRKLMSGEK